MKIFMHTIGLVLLATFVSALCMGIHVAILYFVGADPVECFGWVLRLYVFFRASVLPT